MRVHMIVTGDRELNATCCDHGSALYEAWLDELAHAHDRALKKDGTPWNSASIAAAMTEYFTHRNGRYNTKTHRFDTPPCGECHYGEVTA